MAWLNDNIPKKFSDPRDLFRGFDSLSRADVMLSRAKFGVSWELLSYVFDYIGPGIAFARKYGPMKKDRFGYPDKIKLMARTKEAREKREALARLIAEKIHESKRRVKADVIPYLTVIFRYSKDPKTPARLALGLELEDAMIDFLAGSRSREIKQTIESILYKSREEIEKPRGRESEQQKRTRKSRKKTKEQPKFKPLF